MKENRSWTIKVCPECGPIAPGLSVCPSFHGLTKSGADRTVFTETVEVVPKLEATPSCKCQITNDICPCHGKRAKK